MSNPKIVAFDLDGTLAESKQRLPAETGELLSQLLEHRLVAILSGASLEQFKMQFLPALPVEAKLEHLYIFPVNAAQCFVYRENSWKPEYDHVFTSHEKELILEALQVALTEVQLFKASEKHWGERIEDRGAQISFSPLGQQAPVEAKEEWAKNFGDKRHQLYDILLKKLPDFAIAMGGLTTIDITRKGITKAYGIERLSELAHVSIEEMLYIGDALEEGGNDSVVVKTGIQTHPVFSPDDTVSFIKTLISRAHP